MTRRSTPATTQDDPTPPPTGDEGGSSAPAVTQDDPTRPPSTDEAGRPLDGWGLPNGPARAAALQAAGKRDPLHHPEDWAPASAPDSEA